MQQKIVAWESQRERLTVLLLLVANKCYFKKADLV